MNHPIETRKHTLADGREVTVCIYPDDAFDNPNYWGTIGKFHVFETASHFWKAAEETFGERKARRVIDDLVQGVDVKHDGKVYVGLERYRHSGDVYARCGQGNFPDRQWDVSSIVGWWESSPVYPVKHFDGCLKTWNQYVGGDIYRIEISDADGEYLDSLGGIYGYAEADNHIEAMLDDLTENAQ